MHSSRLLPPPQHQASRWHVVAVAGIAAVAACFLMSFFVDALHESIARGESLRLSLSTAPPATASLGHVSLPAPASLQLARQ